PTGGYMAGYDAFRQQVGGGWFEGFPPEAVQDAWALAWGVDYRVRIFKPYVIPHTFIDTGFQWIPGIEYDVRWEIDLQAKLYSIFIDGQAIVTDGTVPFAGSPLYFNYFAVGQNFNTTRPALLDDVRASWTFDPPASEAAILVSPSALAMSAGPGESDDATLTISNPGDTFLSWSLAEGDGNASLRLDSGNEVPVSFGPTRYVGGDAGRAERVAPKWMDREATAAPERPSDLRATGGPDSFGYDWMDSDEPGGPVFDWQDITTVGVPISLGDDDQRRVRLPFVFPFYGVGRDSVAITSNGYLSFDGSWPEYANTSIPAPSTPNAFIAPFWDDLNPDVGGTIHRLYDGNRFIVQYTDVPSYLQTGVYTFQVQLYPDGTIVYLYQDMQGDLEACTIGIEQDNAYTGLEVAYAAPYVHDGLAVRIGTVDACPSLTEVPQAGLVWAGSSRDVNVHFEAGALSAGEYSCELVILSNVPGQGAVVVPVQMT
ncbi:MAG: hypothetical protein K8E66_10845, partial [Phycisphaerales bacterium]|nr:hypothetical protein [Phycisphaerales bacterium]